MDYGKILAGGFSVIIKEAKDALATLSAGDADYAKRSHFLRAVIMSCEAAIAYAKRYSVLAASMAKTTSCVRRRKELEDIAAVCREVPEYGAKSFREACQSFWFVQAGNTIDTISQFSSFILNQLAFNICFNKSFSAVVF